MVVGNTYGEYDGAEMPSTRQGPRNFAEAHADWKSGNGAPVFSTVDSNGVVRGQQTVFRADDLQGLTNQAITRFGQNLSSLESRVLANEALYDFFLKTANREAADGEFSYTDFRNMVTDQRGGIQRVLEDAAAQVAANNAFRDAVGAGQVVTGRYDSNAVTGSNSTAAGQSPGTIPTSGTSGNSNAPVSALDGALSTYTTNLRVYSGLMAQAESNSALLPGAQAFWDSTVRQSREIYLQLYSLDQASPSSSNPDAAVSGDRSGIRLADAHLLGAPAPTLLEQASEALTAARLGNSREMLGKRFRQRLWE